MILELVHAKGRGRYFAHTFNFVIQKRGLFNKKYKLYISGTGFPFEGYPSWTFNKKGNAEKLKKYIVDRFNSDYLIIDIRNIERQLFEKDKIE